MGNYQLMNDDLRVQYASTSSFRVNGVLYPYLGFAYEYGYSDVEYRKNTREYSSSTVRVRVKKYRVKSCTRTRTRVLALGYP